MGLERLCANLRRYPVDMDCLNYMRPWETIRHRFCPSCMYVWDLALARVPLALSASQDARNSCRNSNTVAENEPRTLSPALSLALSRARSLSLSLTHTHTHTHAHTQEALNMRLPRGEYGTAGETICVCAQGSLSLWMTDWAELDFITFPQHVCCVCST